MSTGKQPLEGLTVRIWDPPSTSKDEKLEENLLKGSRGFRQYTEQIGSDKLKYTTHDWDTDSNSVYRNQGLKQSTRNWNEERVRLDQVKDLPLVSRSESQADGRSLRNVHLQKQLWATIIEKLEKTRERSAEDKQQWIPIVDLFRKLREGVYASYWSNGDYIFATKVFQESINTSIKAHNYQELIKSLSGLREISEITKNPENSYYIVIDILYHSCYIPNTKIVMDRMTKLDTRTEEGKFGKRLVKCLIVSQDPIRYFKLYYNNPYDAFRILMNNYNDTMRLKAIDTLRKAYLSASIEWVGIWLGIRNNNALVLSEIDRLVKPSCIKSVDSELQIVYFLKKRNV